MTPRRRELVELAVSQGVSLAASLGVTLVTAALLGTAGRGQLAFVVGAANLAGALAFANLHVGAIHAHKHGDETAIRRTVRLGVLASAGTLVLGAAITFAADASGSSSASPRELIFATLGAALVSFNLVVLRILQGLGAAREFRVAWTIQSLVYAGAGIPAAWATGSAFPVLVCWFIGIGLSTNYAVRRLPRGAKGVQAFATSSLLKTSLAAHIGSSGIQLLYRMDVVVLSLFVSRADLGIYSIAVPIASMTWMVSEAISLAAFSTYRPGQALPARRSQLARLLRLNLAVGALGSAVLLGVAWFGLSRLLPNYRASIPLIAILLPGVVVQGVARIMFSQITSTGARRPAIVVGLASIGLCLFYFPFCAKWGITGAATASSLIYVLQAVVVVECWRHQHKSEGVTHAIKTRRAHSPDVAAPQVADEGPCAEPPYPRSGD